MINNSIVFFLLFLSITRILPFAAENDNHIGKISIAQNINDSLPKGLTAEKIIDCVIPEKANTAIEIVGIKKWIFQKNCYIVELLSKESYDTIIGDIHSDNLDTIWPSYLSVFKYANDNQSKPYKIALSKPLRFPILSREFAPCVFCTWADNAYCNVYLENSYKVSKNNTAYGIAVSSEYSMMAGCSNSSTTLYIVMISDDQLMLIFSTDIDSSDFVASRSLGEAYESKRLERKISLLTHKTNGYYDIKLSTIHCDRTEDKESNYQTDTILVWDTIKNEY